MRKPRTRVTRSEGWLEGSSKTFAVRVKGREKGGQGSVMTLPGRKHSVTNCGKAAKGEGAGGAGRGPGMEKKDWPAHARWKKRIRSCRSSRNAGRLRAKGRLAGARTLKGNKGRKWNGGEGERSRAWSSFVLDRATLY